MIRVRPKAERDLDDALAVIETIAPERRVTENKAAVKEALAMLRQAGVEGTGEIEKALKKLSHNAAKHEGLQHAVMQIAGKLEAMIAEMQRRRKRRQSDEEKISWLLS